MISVFASIVCAPYRIVRMLASGRWRELIIRADSVLHTGYLDFRYETSEEVGIESQGHAHRTSAFYVEYALSRIDIVATDAIIDVGAGKGRAMVAMARFPFARVAGVEISARLTRTANRNLLRLCLLNRGSVLQADAAVFADYDDFNYVYFFNPFPRAVMAATLAWMVESLRRRPRRLRIIYNAALFGEEVLMTGAFAVVDELRPRPGHAPIIVYESVREIPEFTVPAARTFAPEEARRRPCSLAGHEGNNE